MRLVIPFICLLFSFSCAPKQPVHVPHVATGDAVVTSKLLVSEADRNVVEALPHANDTGKQHLTSAHRQLGEAAGNLDVAHVQLGRLRQDIGVKDDTIVEQKTKLDAYSQRWLGDRLLHWIRVIVVTGIIATVVGWGLTLYGLTGGGLVATIAAYVGRGVLSFIPIIGSWLIWRADHTWLSKQTRGK